MEQVHNTHAFLEPDCTEFGEAYLERIESYGDVTALVCSETGASLTFRQFSDKARAMSAVLSQTLYLQKGNVVSVLLPNCPDHFVSIVGLIHAGGVYCGLNPLFTSEEIQAQIVHSESTLVFVDVMFLEKIVDALKIAVEHNVKNVVVFGDRKTEDIGSYSQIGSDVNVVHMEDLLEKGLKTKPKNFTINKKKDLAYMPYSSGTTGKPKGVMMSHNNIINYTLGPILNVLCPMNTGDTAIAVLPLFHILGFLVYQKYLAKGVKIVTVKKFHPVQFAELIEQYKVSILLAVPSLLLALVKTPGAADADFSSVRHILFAAAPMGLNLLNDVIGRFRNLKTLQQIYGSSEVGGATVTPINRDLKDTSTLTSVGVPVPGGKVSVMDEGGNEVPTGASGEVWVFCPHAVMLGYLHNPEMTAEMLVNGWLRTGDFGYKDENGNLFITDRMKDMIKYKGFQIAPAEIEDILLKHPAVAECGVCGVPNPQAVERGECPTAFVILKQEHKPSTGLADEIKGHVAEHLAEYKHLSGGVFFVEQLPKTASGKVQRRLLTKASVL